MTFVKLRYINDSAHPPGTSC